MLREPAARMWRPRVALKNLGLRWRNAMLRSNHAADVDENRLILSYSLPLL